MKIFLVKIAIFLSLFCFAYSCLFYMIDEGIKKSEYQDYAEWNEIYNGDIDADLIIMGSSRAWRQIDPKILDDKLNSNSYNLGIDGYHVPMQLTKYKIYADRNDSPKEMVYIVDHFSLDKRKDLFNKYQFAPYFSDTLLTNRLKEYEGFKWQHYCAQYFQYSGSKEICLAGLAQFLGLKKFQSNKYKGFRARDAEWEPDFDIEKKLKPEGKRAEVDSATVVEFNEFIEQQSKKGINITVVYAPDYIEFQNYITNRDSILDIYQSICTKNNIDFIDYSKDGICLDKTYFYNPTHLNSKGVPIFSEDLANKLRQSKSE